MSSGPNRPRARRELRGPRHALIGVLAVGAVAALVSAIHPVDVSSVVGRAVLVILIGGTQALAAGLLVVHHVRARSIALWAALFAMGWGTGHMMVSGWTWFEIGAFGFGALELLLLAGCTPRDTGKRTKRQRGRR